MAHALAYRQSYDRDFAAFIDAYLAPHGRSTAAIVAFIDAHPRDTLKFGQARLRAAAAVDLSVSLSAEGLCRAVRRATGPVSGARVIS